jgi:imidazolonepropionase
MKKVLIKDIRFLMGVSDDPPAVLRGKEMAHLPVLENAWLAIEDGRIADYGSMANWPGISDWRDLEVIDAEGGSVLPGFVDSHTHLVHTGTREGEFVDRIRGLSYADIAARGGGILNSAAKLANAHEDDLFEESLIRVKQAMRMGTLAFEIKSGYGLSLEAELKMLRVIKRIKETVGVPVKATFLGAHAVPLAFKGNTKGYVKHVIEIILPRVAEAQLADYIDVFCEAGYFDVEDTLQIIEAGMRYGMRAKVHVNQFQAIGGIAAAVHAGALSVDHLEVLHDDDLLALTGGGTIPVALPGCSLFLGIPYTPARKLIDAGLPLALASDYNPGSAPSANMHLVVALACTQMRMLPAEAINAATINAAAALELEGEVGAISPGMLANLIITEVIPSPEFIPYAFGSQLIKNILVNGSILNQ